MTLTLRPYQRESIDATYAHWAGGGGNGLVVIPTGGGKSLIIAQLLKELHDRYPLMRICVATHSRELIAQNFSELMTIWPQAPAGIYSAGIGRRDKRAPILFVGIQSVWNKPELFSYFDLIIVDEAHLISRNGHSMYGEFFLRMRDKKPSMRVWGATATPYRLDSGRLDKGEGRLFDKIIYDANVRDLIDDGYLSRLISKHTHSEIDVTGVHKRGGDFIANELEAAAMAGDLVDRAAAEIVKHGKNRRAWLAFCTGLGHAAAVRDALMVHGISVEMIDGTMAKGERDDIINRFRKGELQCLTSVNVLSIGFNVPHVDLIALLRPTQSCGLYIQQVGRGFRLAPGKTNCLVLDFAGNVSRHGPVDDVTPETGEVREGEEGEGIAPHKVCPSCDSFVHPRIMICPDCQYIWPEPEKHEAKPSEAPILTPRTGDGYEEVTDVRYYRHEKRGDPSKPPTMRVTYGLGNFKVVNEWISFDPKSHYVARDKSAQWWIQCGGNLPVPEDVEMALLRTEELLQVTHIRSAKDNNGFMKVTGRKFAPRDPMKIEELQKELQDEIPF